MSTPIEDENEMSLEKFKMFNINALKSFLYVRGKSNEGSLDELAARAFVAYSENVQPIETFQNEERVNSDFYRQKLIINDIVAPDPLSLKDGWIGEANAIVRWPSIYYMDIADHLSVLGPEFLKQLQRDYKVGKSYRYFASNFLREVYYHPISETSKYCILRGRVVPSHNTGMTPYFVWVIASNDYEDNPGGSIESAYCTCIGGMAGTCNHVTALMFRIELAVIKGLTKPSKTSKLCQWNIPSGTKINLEPMAAEDMVFKQNNYANVSDRDLEKEREAFIAYRPSLHQSQAEEIASGSLKNKLYTAVQNHIKGSRISEVFEKKQREETTNKAIDVPKTLFQLVNDFPFDKNLTLEQNITSFVSNVNITQQQVINLKALTSKQAESEDWKSHRYGRITASNYHKVCTRVDTLKVKPEESAKNLVDLLLNKKPYVATKATRHGKALEPIAIKRYIYLEKKKHKKFNFNEVGLVIMKKHFFVGASPDLEIDCECCGAGLLEIKCPYSILNSTPNATNLPYLHEVISEEDTTIVLKKNTAYFFQVQGQMAVTERKYCDFFVYTKYGHHLERITFDENFWLLAINKIVWFWMNHVAPALLNENTEKIPTKTVSSPIDFTTSTCKQSKPNMPNIAKNTTVIKKLTTLNTDISPNISKTNISNKTKTTTKNTKTKTSIKNTNKVAILNTTTKVKSAKCKKSIKRKHANLFLCGECKKELVETPKNFKEESVGCDKCPIWYHFACVKITPGTAPKPGESWNCKNCSDI